jgi:Cu-Zn family superoxide dismutase
VEQNANHHIIQRNLMAHVRSNVFLLPVTLAIALLLCSSSASSQHTMHMSAAPAPVTSAIALLHPTEGSSVHGTVTFEQVQNGVRVRADISGLTPGKHGFHIHEFGDCSAPDGSSAGGHFNPAGMAHGAPSAKNRHEGDMGNIEADKDGHATLDYVDHVMQLTGPESILGRGVIVHAKEDDLKTQPTGNAGPRVACGVIGVAKAK